MIIILILILILLYNDFSVRLRGQSNLLLFIIDSRVSIFVFNNNNHLRWRYFLVSFRVFISVFRIIVRGSSLFWLVSVTFIIIDLFC